MNVTNKIKDPARTRLYHKYKYNAKKRNIKWHIGHDFFFALTKLPCYYCGKAPRNLIKDRSKKYECKYSGVDRRSSHRGYSEANCVPCCSTCNSMKGRRSVSDYIKQCFRVSKWNK